MKAVKTTLIGAGIGLAASICLIILGVACDFVSCACAIISCESSYNSMSDGILGNFGGICLFCVICGAIIGLVYGLYKMKEEADEINAKKYAEEAEADRQRRKKWASEICQKALKTEQSCKDNAEAMKAPLVATMYKSDDMMALITSELTRASELQGKIDALASDVKKEGE